MAEKTIKFTGMIVTETEKAILFNVEGREYWFPLSTVNSITRSPAIDCDEIEVAEWLAKKKGLAE